MTKKPNRSNNYEFNDSSDFVKTIRKDLGMTQKGLAKKLQVNQGTISNWENGKTEIGFYYIKKVLRLLNRSFVCLTDAELYSLKNNDELNKEEN